MSNQVIPDGTLREAIEQASINVEAQPFVVAFRDGKVQVAAVEATVTHTPSRSKATGKQDEASTVSLVTAPVATIVAAATFGLQRKVANACHNRGPKDEPQNATKAQRDKSRRKLQTALDAGEWKLSRSDRPAYGQVIDMAMCNLSAKLKERTVTDRSKFYRALDTSVEAQAAQLAKIVAEAERLQAVMATQASSEELGDVEL